jgi:hypothetical protein
MVAISGIGEISDLLSPSLFPPHAQKLCGYAITDFTDFTDSDGVSSSRYREGGMILGKHKPKHVCVGCGRTIVPRGEVC